MEPDLSRMPITLTQQKLLANALRIKILHVLADEPRSAKQVADTLGETVGNIHYHIQKLYRADLLELAETREVGGVVEKCYRAKSTRFQSTPSSSVLCVYSRLVLTRAEAEQISQELEQVLHRWERATARRSADGAKEYEIRTSATPIHDAPPA